MNNISLLIAFLAVFSTAETFAQFQLKSPAKDDETTCLPCERAMRTIPVDVTWSVEVIGGQIVFKISDHSYIAQIFSNDVDGIAADVVRRDQYKCGKKINLKLSKWKNGTLVKPIYYVDFKSAVKKNKDGSGQFSLGALPDVSGTDYEINLLFIKGKTVCYNNSFFDRHNKRWELLEMGMYMDTATTKVEVITTKKVVFKDHAKRFKFIVPFKKNKYEYAPADVKPMMDSLRLTDYQIQTIDIHAYASVEGTTANNLKLQEKRATSMIAAVATFQSEKIKTTVNTSENWVEFIEDLRKDKKKDLAKLSKEELKQKLNKEGLSKQVEHLLKNHRKAVITMSLTKRTKHEKETKEFVVTNIKKTIVNKDVEEALRLQREMFARVSSGQMSVTELDNIDIPANEEYSSLLSNRIAFNYQNGGNIKDVLAGFEDLYSKMPTNGILYNVCALKLILWFQGEMLMTPRKLKVQILKLKKAGFDQQLTYRLLCNFHMVRASYAMGIKDYEMNTRSVNFLKGQYRKAQESDEDMIRVARYLRHYGKAKWAEMILNPHARRIDVDAKLIYAYLNLSLTDPSKDRKKKYRAVILNILNLDPEGFCALFKSHEAGGTSFQLLANKYLNEQYCEACEGTK